MWRSGLHVDIRQKKRINQCQDRPREQAGQAYDVEQEKIMIEGYREWLEGQKYQSSTITTQLNRVGRVERCHGDLDDHHRVDRMTSLIKDLTYSTDDKRHNRPNPSKIEIDGDIKDNLASYRNAVKLYMKYLDSIKIYGELPSNSKIELMDDREETGQRIGLERDLQAALRIDIAQIEPGLTITDDGAERSVDSGFIDITAIDAQDITVVIELKAGTAGQRAIAQILSYMGDVSMEEENGQVRGILVASDFDSKAKAAAKMVPNLILRKYSVRFTFSDGQN